MFPGSCIVSLLIVVRIDYCSTFGFLICIWHSLEDAQSWW